MFNATINIATSTGSGDQHAQIHTVQPDFELQKRREEKNKYNKVTKNIDVITLWHKDQNHFNVILDAKDYTRNQKPVTKSSKVTNDSELTEHAMKNDIKKTSKASR